VKQERQPVLGSGIGNVSPWQQKIKHRTIEDLLEAILSALFMPELYNECQNRMILKRILSSMMLRCVAVVSFTTASGCNIPEDGILHSHHHENLKS
jgi:hypothetical protein